MKSQKTQEFSVISRDRRAREEVERTEATKRAMGRVLEARNLSGTALHLQNRLRAWIEGVRAQSDS